MKAGTLYLYKVDKCNWCDGIYREASARSLVRVCDKCGGQGVVATTIDFETALKESPLIEDMRDAIFDLLNH